MNSPLVAVLLLAASSAALAQPSPPLLEKDPWGSFKPGSSVKVRRGTSEYTLTLRVDEDKNRFFERDPEDEDFDGTYAFTGYLTTLRADGSGYTRVGKSNAKVQVGTKQLQALVEEFQAGDADDFGNADRIKVTSSDAVPGGIVKVARDVQGESGREKWVYEFKLVEKMKIAAKEVECFRFDLTETEGKKKKSSSYWLCADIPGMLVKVATAMTTFEVLEFKAER